MNSIVLNTLPKADKVLIVNGVHIEYGFCEICDKNDS